MARVLVLFFHPGQRHSRMNMALARQARAVERITFVDVYAQYPKFNIDIDREQQRLLDHEVIVFQFPVYWYSTPPLMKEWQDLVLEYDFAYGPKGDRLKGKLFLPVVTTGGGQDAYREEGYNHFRLRTLFSPLEQTANLCQMPFIPPLVLFGAQRAVTDGRAETHTTVYRQLLEALRDDQFDIEAARQLELMSDTNLPLLAGDRL